MILMLFIERQTTTPRSVNAYHMAGAVGVGGRHSAAQTRWMAGYRYVLVRIWSVRRNQQEYLYTAFVSFDVTYR